MDDPGLNQVIILEVIQWLSLRKPLPVPIVEKPSPLLPKSRNSTQPKVSLMNPSVVLLAGRPGNRNGAAEPAAAMVAAVHGKCIPPPAPGVVSRPKFPFSLAGINRFIAGTATIKIPKFGDIKSE